MYDQVKCLDPFVQVLLTVIASHVGNSTLLDSACWRILPYTALMLGGAGVVRERAKGASMSAFKLPDSFDITVSYSVLTLASYTALRVVVRLQQRRAFFELGHRLGGRRGERSGSAANLRPNSHEPSRIEHGRETPETQKCLVCGGISLRREPRAGNWSGWRPCGILPAAGPGGERLIIPMGRWGSDRQHGLWNLNSTAYPASGELHYFISKHPPPVWIVIVLNNIVRGLAWLEA